MLLSTDLIDLLNHDLTGHDCTSFLSNGYSYGKFWGIMVIYIILVSMYVLSTAQSSCLSSGALWSLCFNNLWMCYPRLRFLGEGLFQKALLLCLWTCVLSVCYNFYVGWILEEHGRHDWTVSLWAIRVDPCPKSPYIFFS